jgi:ATP-dependent Lon protease
MNGMDSEQVAITNPALAHVIHSYTREAGVRNLERAIGEWWSSLSGELMLPDR